jgi:chromosome segregation ATPase
MNTLKSSKTIAVVATTILIAMVFWLLNTKRASHLLEEGLQESRLKSEALLSEKLLLEKEIDKMKEQLVSLTDRNAGLDELVQQTTEKLRHQESDYNRMKKENLTLAQVKKQRANLEALRTGLEKEMQGLKELNAYLQDRNNELTGTVASLQERNRLLTEDLHKATLASLDQSQIRAVRGKNEKLTVNARRTRKLVASFEAPSDLKNLSFRIVDSKGNTLSPAEGSIAFHSTPSESNYTASIDADVMGNKSQRVEMVYTPKKKLKSGVYTVEILNENLYVGSLKVKLN